MIKTKYLLLAICVAASLGMACAKSAPPAMVEYRDVCTEANKDKKISVQGFLNVADKTPCMMLLMGSSVKRGCAFKLMDKINVTGKEIIAYIPEGREKNQAETPDAGGAEVKTSKIFARNEIKIHLDDGTVVEPQENVATPVTVTGEVSLSGTDADQVCTISAGRIEKR